MGLRVERRGSGRGMDGRVRVSKAEPLLLSSLACLGVRAHKTFAIGVPSNLSSRLAMSEALCGTYVVAAPLGGVGSRRLRSRPGGLVCAP